jgi:sec-independent protein translocase protein TatB
MDLGVSELVFIFLLALLLFGPKKLPEIGKQIGKALAEFKRAKNEFQNQLSDEMRQLELQAEAEKASKEATAPPPVIEGTVTRPGTPFIPENAAAAAADAGNASASVVTPVAKGSDA